MCVCCVCACVCMLAVCIVYVCRMPLLMVGRQHCRQEELLYYLALIELEPIV